MNDRQRVLVCDDEPQILRAVRITLRDEGFEVVVTATATEALDAAALRSPDAAILDLLLPDGDGVEVTRTLREWSAVPIIVLSAVGEEEEKVRALEAGAVSARGLRPPSTTLTAPARSRRARAG